MKEGKRKLEQELKENHKLKPDCLLVKCQITKEIMSKYSINHSKMEEQKILSIINMKVLELGQVIPLEHNNSIKCFNTIKNNISKLVQITQ